MQHRLYTTTSGDERCGGARVSLAVGTHAVPMQQTLSAHTVAGRKQQRTQVPAHVSVTVGTHTMPMRVAA